jgi:hypothetical protein
MQRGAFRLVERAAGDGELIFRNTVLGAVQYSVERYQGFLEGSGLPVPGLHRIEGSVSFTVGDELAHLIGAPLVLRLADGRALAVTLADREGRILAEGHGPCGGCSCC